jgi:type VI secretion system FHA domain protein
MPLTLEVVGQKAGKMGAGARKVFQGAGTIGRLRDNDWVLPDEYISGHHARILFANGSYQIEDTSTNGVFINSPQNRMTRGKPYTLRNGDTVYIDDYEVRVTLGAESAAAGPYAAAKAPIIPADPFAPESDEFLVEPNETDPLKLLGLQDARPLPPGPSAAGLASQSPMAQHYRPPAAPQPTPAPPRVVQPPPVPAPMPMPGGGKLIPDDYDPFASDDSPAPPPRPVRPAPPPPQAAAPPPQASAPAPMSPQTVYADPPRPPRPAVRPPPAEPPRPAAAVRPASAPVRPAPPPMARPAPPPQIPPVALDAGGERPEAGAGPSLDFASMLAGAGIDAARVTPELAHQFGQILRVVVAGVMDVLRARERIKDEFRMRMTTFKTTDNNPLKFSVNVEDALHNLLVKRNAAFLGPVEAFEDAFQDVRNHQMAMLAGVRVAYEAMLAEFEPGRLQEKFDRQGKSGSFLSGGAKSKYWELYSNKFHDMVKDADTSFRHLFGDEFAKAYEEQLARLKTLNRAERR